MVGMPTVTDTAADREVARALRDAARDVGAAALPAAFREAGFKLAVEHHLDELRRSREDGAVQHAA